MTNEKKVALSMYKNVLSRRHQLLRFTWNMVWYVLARPLPRSVGSSWKRFLLRLFGAKIHKTAVVYSTAKIYYPPNLEMDAYSIMAPDVDCYNVERIKIGANTMVSQKSFLCTASHDISNTLMPLVAAPIIIEDQVWIAADAFLGMGVTIKQGAVIGARSVVLKDVERWTVVGGNPAKFIKKRILK